MPIANLTTNTQQAFMKLGKIRKGDRGGKNGAPRDLDHFRVTFMDGAKSKALEDAFRKTYGPEPTEINVRVPYNEIHRFWDANYECYKQGGLVAQAGSTENGDYWIFYRDPESSEVLVRNGSAVGEEGRIFLSNNPCDVNKPIYYNANKEPVMLDPVGRLQVVIPELAGIEVGYFEFTPTSPRDIRTLSAELSAFDAIAKSFGKGLAGVPFKLIRRKETVTKKIKDKLTQGDSWVVHITTGGDWGVKAIEAVERMALPDVVDVEPEDVTDYGSVDEAFPLLTPATGPITPMPYEEAVKVTIAGKDKTVKRIVDLDREKLEWIINNTEKTTFLQQDAARTILIVDHGAAS